MAFRNPLTSLSGDDITPGTITGSILQTGATGQRIVITPDDHHSPGVFTRSALLAYSGNPNEVWPVSLTASEDGEVTLESAEMVEGQGAALVLGSPEDGNPPYFTLATGGVGPTMTTSGTELDVFIPEGSFGTQYAFTADGITQDGAIIAAPSTGWMNLALKTGFTAGTPDAPQWRRFTMFGTEFVQFRGRITHAGLTADTVFATLASAKPSVTRRFPVGRNSASTGNTTRVDWNSTAGDMAVAASSVALTLLSLDGVIVAIT